MTAATFGACICGRPKAEHSQEAQSMNRIRRPTNDSPRFSSREIAASPATGNTTPPPQAAPSLQLHSSSSCSQQSVSQRSSPRPLQGAASVVASTAPSSPQQPSLEALQVVALQAEVDRLKQMLLAATAAVPTLLPVPIPGPPARAPPAPAPAVSSPLGSYQASTWEGREWIRSLDLHEEVWTALSARHAPGKSELELVLELSDAELADRFLSLGGVLVERVRAGIASLKQQDAHTAKEWNDKWVASNGCFTFDYGSLDTYYGGLEALVGLPSVHIYRAMVEEHTQV